MKFWPLKDIPWFKRGDKRTLVQSSDANELVAAINALRHGEIKRGGSDKIVFSDGKIVWQIKRDVEDVVAASDKLYRVKSASANHLVCRTWNGSEEGADDVLVAKSISARQPLIETISGTEYDYNYSAGPDALNDYRVATWATGNEQQIVTPYWTLNGLLHVAPIDYSGVTVSGSDIKLIEVSSRCWARTT